MTIVHIFFGLVLVFLVSGCASVSNARHYSGGYPQGIEHINERSYDWEGYARKIEYVSVNNPYYKRDYSQEVEYIFNERLYDWEGYARKIEYVSGNNPYYKRDYPQEVEYVFDKDVTSEERIAVREAVEMARPYLKESGYMHGVRVYVFETRQSYNESRSPQQVIKIPWSMGYVSPTEVAVNINMEALRYRGDMRFSYPGRYDVKPEEMGYEDGELMVPLLEEVVVHELYHVMQISWLIHDNRASQFSGPEVRWAILGSTEPTAYIFSRYVMSSRYCVSPYEIFHSRVRREIAEELTPSCSREQVNDWMVVYLRENYPGRYLYLYRNFGGIQAFNEHFRILGDLLNSDVSEEDMFRLALQGAYGASSLDQLDNRAWEHLRQQVHAETTVVKK